MMSSASRKRYAILAALLLSGLLLVGFGRRSLYRSFELAFTSIECDDPPSHDCAAQLEHAERLRFVGNASLWLGGGLVLLACALEVARALRSRRSTPSSSDDSSSV
jgi:hypothetical protein